MGQNWYRDNRNSRQPTLMDINSLMEFISGLGDVNINKAYANWGFFFPYNYDLQGHAVDLIQLFPRGRHGKNGADIRMAIDVIEDITANPHITTVVIVGGDSDYISIAQKVRQRGKSIIGIGVKETTNQYWIKSCNEFKFYSSLLMRSSSIVDLESEGYEESDIEEARELLCKAVAHLATGNDKNLAKKAAVKPLMMRLDPSFDESNYGFKSFGEFLDNFRDTITISQGEYDHMVSLVSADGQANPLPEVAPQHPYQRILKRQQIRLVDPKMLKAAVRQTWEIFQTEPQLSSYRDFRERLVKGLELEGFRPDETDISKIKGILYKCFVFKQDPVHRVIGLSPSIKKGADLERMVQYMFVKRILDNTEDEPDLAELARIIHGDPAQAGEVAPLVEHFKRFNHNH